MGKADVTRHLKSKAHAAAVKCKEDRWQPLWEVTYADNKVSTCTCLTTALRNIANASAAVISTSGTQSDYINCAKRYSRKFTLGIRANVHDVCHALAVQLVFVLYDTHS